MNLRGTRTWVLAAGASSALAISLSCPSRAHARATFEIDYADAEGEGFFDATPRVPLDDNPGTTLGEQRRLAFEHALEIWSRALASDVVIVIEATFAPFPELPCSNDSAVLGAARAESAFSGFRGARRADLLYPAPLADKLAGRDLAPGEPDLSALFNPRVDEADCLRELGWHYGFRAGSTQVEFVNTVLHELTHGLGFASLVDEFTGEAELGLSVFETLMFDNLTGRTWDQLSAPERLASLTSPHGLSWSGQRVTDAVPSLLAQGRPRVEFGDQALSLVSEPSFGPWLSAAEVDGELVALSPRQACEGGTALGGRIPLLQSGPQCPDLGQQLDAVAARGAAAALMRSLYDGQPPFGLDGRLGDAPIPSLALSQVDFDALHDASLAGTLQIRLTTDAEWLGTDGQGRVLLSATSPVQPGSSASHWDTSARRIQASFDDPVNLLMEPTAAGRSRNELSDLTVQLLQDLGWTDVVCGNGVLEAGEQCDEAIANSDRLANACRMDCSLPRCGDGVLDDGEACDGEDAGPCTDQCTVPVEPEPPPSVPDAGAGGPDTPAPDPSPGEDAGSGPGPPPARADAAVGEQPSRDAGDERFEREAGCACRSLGAPWSGSAWGWAALGVWLACLVRRSRRDGTR